MIKLYLNVMSGIIYRSVIFGLLLIILGCKNEGKNEEKKDSVTSKTLNINDIKLITIKDTLFLNENTDQFGDEWRKYQNYKESFTELLVKHKKFDRETSTKYREFHYGDNEELIKNSIVFGRIKLNEKFNTIILFTTDFYILLNYNEKGELIDFLDLSKYNQLFCRCMPKLFIDSKGIINCYIESVAPYYPYVLYNVNNQGKFEIIKKYTPLDQKNMSDADRFQYIIKKTDLLKDIENLRLDIGPNDPIFSRSTLLNIDEIKRIFFSKSKFSQGYYNSLLEVLKIKQKDDAGIYIYGKMLSGDKTLLIAYPEMIDDLCVIFILNSKNEITDLKIFNTVHDEEEVTLQKIDETQILLGPIITSDGSFKNFILRNNGKFIEEE